jgi:antitoxin (DNA-binding transcriptional repressor) of toxin-antitoxin stability system
VAEITATEAARQFSQLLDTIEHRRKSFVITRGGRAVASIHPVPTATGRVAKRLLGDGRPDPAWAKELDQLRGSLVMEQREWRE